MVLFRFFTFGYLFLITYKKLFNYNYNYNSLIHTRIITFIIHLMYLYKLYCCITVLLYYDKWLACLCRLCDVFHICKDLRKVNKYDVIWHDMISYDMTGQMKCCLPFLQAHRCLFVSCGTVCNEIRHGCTGDEQHSMSNSKCCNFSR